MHQAHCSLCLLLLSHLLHHGPQANTLHMVLNDGIGQLIGMAIKLFLGLGHGIELAGYALHLTLDPLHLVGLAP